MSKYNTLRNYIADTKWRDAVLDYLNAAKVDPDWWLDKPGSFDYYEDIIETALNRHPGAHRLNAERTLFVLPTDEEMIYTRQCIEIAKN